MKWIITMKWMMFVLLCLSLGCATAPKPTVIRGDWVEATPTTPPQPAPRVVPLPYPQAVPAQAKPLPKVPTPAQIEAAKKDKRSTSQILDAANKKATQTPVEDGYFNSIQTYNYMPGSLYQVWGAPNHITVIEFAPGETFHGGFSGDNVRWLIKETETGSGKNLRKVVLVQPTMKGLHTTFIVTTSIGTYHFEFRSFQHSYMAAVRFRYPQLQMQRFAKQLKAQAKQRAKAKPVRLAVDLDRIDDRYQMVVKDAKNPPAWTPKRIFHDGVRTYIEFPKNVDRRAKPALFLLSKTKRVQLVQFGIKGRYYVIPQVVRFATLRMGKTQSVSIEYKGGKR